MFPCNACQKVFNRRFNLLRHQQRAHLYDNQIVEKCILCGQVFNSCDEIQAHYLTAHKPSKNFIVKESAFKKNFVTYRYTFLPNEEAFVGAQTKLKKLIMRQIMNEAAQKIMAKISLIFIAEMIMEDMSGQTITKAAIPFRAASFYANGTNQRAISFNVRKSFQQQQAHLDDFMRSGSNWRFSRALAFDMEVCGVSPVRGGSNQIGIKKFKNNLNLYNPQNKDNKCFLYCIAYFMLFGLLVNKKLIAEDHLRIKKYTKKFAIENLTFPLSVNDIKKFLRINPKLNLKVNVLYRTSQDQIYPFEYGLGNGKRLVNLLLVESKESSHYLVIKNMDNFLKKVYRNSTSLKNTYQKKFFCANCLNGFSSTEIKDQHIKLCSVNKPRIENTPEEGNNFISFKHYERKHFLDYIAYLDFECVLPNSKQKCMTCNSLKCKCDCSFTDEINRQEPICYSFLVLGENDKVVHEKTFSGLNAHIHFIEHLLQQEEIWIKDLLNTFKALLMEPKDYANFKKSKKCYMCSREFSSGLVKVRDHSHFTGKYIGAACQKCNLRRRMPTSLKIFVHNCAKYDMHFLIKALSHFQDRIRNISVLPYNGENFRTLRFNCFEFIDTLAFLQASLSQLTADLRLTNHQYSILKQTYLVKKKGAFNKERLEMVLEKSFFPYEYCTSYDKMLSTKSLPTKEEFYSCLSGKSISDEDHFFAQTVWKEFGCKHLVQYCEKYCKIDTVLLAEVFQKFRRQMFEFSGLDPAHYISLPSFGYDSMLLMTGANLELPTDINMVHFMEKCKRGGVSFINTRHLQANQEGDIVYIDANNL